MRGATAPGVPVIGLGHNEHVAWGVTSGLSDDDDLYVEQLVSGQPEKYVFRGQTRDMECRDEVFRYRAAPDRRRSGAEPGRRVRLGDAAPVPHGARPGPVPRG